MNGRWTVLALPLALLLGLIMSESNSMGADVPCRFKSLTEPVHISVLSNGTSLWTGTIEKDNPQSVDIPEGPFTVISKVYNPNLQTTGDVRAEAHTRMCREKGALPVPLFADAP
jgi:hypothetical protein